MEESAAERRLPGDVPDEVKGRGVDLLIASDRDRLAFPAGKNRLERDIPFEHAAAACVNVTRGSADLRVGISGEILESEIDQAPFPLQQGKPLNGAIGTITRGGLSWRLGASIGLERSRQTTFEENGEKCRDRQLDPGPQSHLTLRRRL